MRLNPALGGVIAAFCLAEQPGGGLLPIAVAALSACVLFVAEAAVSAWRTHLRGTSVRTASAP